MIKFAKGEVWKDLKYWLKIGSGWRQPARMWVLVEGVWKEVAVEQVIEISASTHNVNVLDLFTAKYGFEPYPGSTVKVVVKPGVTVLGRALTRFSPAPAAIDFTGISISCVCILENNGQIIGAAGMGGMPTEDDKVPAPFATGQSLGSFIVGGPLSTNRRKTEPDAALALGTTTLTGGSKPKLLYRGGRALDGYDGGTAVRAPMPLTIINNGSILGGGGGGAGIGHARLVRFFSPDSDQYGNHYAFMAYQVASNWPVPRFFDDWFVNGTQNKWHAETLFTALCGRPGHGGMPLDVPNFSFTDVLPLQRYLSYSPKAFDTHRDNCKASFGSNGTVREYAITAADPTTKVYSPERVRFQYLSNYYKDAAWYSGLLSKANPGALQDYDAPDLGDTFQAMAMLNIASGFYNGGLPRENYEFASISQTQIKDGNCLRNSTDSTSGTVASRLVAEYYAEACTLHPGYSASYDKCCPWDRVGDGSKITRRIQIIAGEGGAHGEDGADARANVYSYQEWLSTKGATVARIKGDDDFMPATEAYVFLGWNKFRNLPTWHRSAQTMSFGANGSKADMTIQHIPSLRDYLLNLAVMADPYWNSGEIELIPYVSQSPNRSTFTKKTGQYANATTKSRTLPYRREPGMVSYDGAIPVAADNIYDFSPGYVSFDALYYDNSVPNYITQGFGIRLGAYNGIPVMPCQIGKPGKGGKAVQAGAGSTITGTGTISGAVVGV